MEQQPIVDPQQVVAAAVAQQQQADALLLQQLQQQFTQAQQENAALRSQLQAAAASSSSSFPGAQGRPLVRDLKPMKPSPFTGGTGANAEQWLLEMERYFQAADSPQSGRVLFAATFLKESASAWFNSLWPEAEAEREASIRACTWSEFKEHFRARFRPLAASRTARSILRTLTQKYRVASYTDAFLKQMQLIPDMAMADQVESYIHGLQPHLAVEVDRGNPDTLVKAMNLAQLEETRLSTSRGPSHRGRFNTGSYAASYRRGGDERYRYGGAAAAAASDDRMDISAMEQDQPAEDGEEGETVQVMQHGSSDRGGGGSRRFPAGNRVRNLSREDFDRLSREGKCFRCREPDHLARNCPKSFAKPSALKSGN